MKFFNHTIDITQEQANNKIVKSIVQNTDSQKSCIIITLQIINNNDSQITLTFKRLNLEANEPTKYESIIKFNKGTTILDHIMVVSPQTSYSVMSDNAVTISCSYGI